MDDARPYIVDKIFARRQIHLLGGISSSGKSRLMIRGCMAALDCGLPLWGQRSRITPWCLVSSDRPIEDPRSTIASFGVDPSTVKIIGAFGKHEKSQFQIMEAIEKTKSRFVLWEGFDCMVKNPNSPYEVREFLSNLTAYCEDDDLTILGTVGVPKLKPHEAYENPRQLIGGTTIWERCTGTNLLLTTIKPKDVADGRRRLYVCLKDHASFQLDGKFNAQGALEMYEEGVFPAEE